MFHTYISSVLSGCCVYFTIVSSVFFKVFLQVFLMYVSSVSSVFRRILQVLHLDVSKIDQVLHLPPRLLLPRLNASSSSWCRLGMWTRGTGGRCPLSIFLMLVTFGAVRAPSETCERSAGAGVRTRASVRRLVLPLDIGYLIWPLLVWSREQMTWNSWG
jgi:hypothetical protein